LWYNIFFVPFPDGDVGNGNPLVLSLSRVAVLTIEPLLANKEDLA
jgi:hypothetical protein